MGPDTELLTGREEVKSSSEATLIDLVPNAHVMDTDVIAGFVDANVLVLG